jgi:cytochrome c-type biogenesis protein CcmH
MTQFYASIVIGTAATATAIALLLLRLKVEGRRPAVALVRRWIATDTRTSGFVVALMISIAASSFASIPTHELTEPHGTSPPSASVAAGNENENSPADQAALVSLRAYVDKIDTNSQPEPATPAPSASPALPDVDTMIAKLVTRLETEPGDVKGWKMLGWSYLNTEKPYEAEKAYQTALKLDPGDIEIKKGLEAAKTAQTATTGTMPAASDEKSEKENSVSPSLHP